MRARVWQRNIRQVVWYSGLWSGCVAAVVAVIAVVQPAGFSSVPQSDGALPEERVGCIVGAVVSDSGQPMPGVQVVIMRQDEEVLWARGITTDEAGQFALDGLQPGVYVVQPPARARWRFAPGEYRLFVDGVETDEVVFRAEPPPARTRTYWQRTTTHRAVFG